MYKIQSYKMLKHGYYLDLKTEKPISFGIKTDNFCDLAVFLEIQKYTIFGAVVSGAETGDLRSA